MPKSSLKIRYVERILLLISLSVILVGCLNADLLEAEPVTASGSELVTHTATMPLPSSTATQGQSPTATPTESVEGCLASSPQLLFLVLKDGLLTRINVDAPLEPISIGATNATKYFSPFDLSPSENLIVFTSDEDNGADIVLSDFDGHVVQRLTENDAEETSPRFSPNGDAIAFTIFKDNSYDVTVIDLEGEVATQFDVNACQPEIAWLDDERLIVIACSDQPDLLLLNFTTGQTSRLTNTPGEERSPDASPNGEMITFLCQDVSDTEFDLCVLEMETGDNQQLVQKLDHQSAPAWSTLGDGIVYATGEEIVHIKLNGDEKEVLYSPAMQNSIQNFWHPRLANDTCEATFNFNTTSSTNSSYLTMKANECTACHVTVVQTHMERLDQICQECHADVDQLHAGVEEAIP